MSSDLQENIISLIVVACVAASSPDTRRQMHPDRLTRAGFKISRQFINLRRGPVFIAFQADDVTCRHIIIGCYNRVHEGLLCTHVRLVVGMR